MIFLDNPLPVQVKVKVPLLIPRVQVYLDPWALGCQDRLSPGLVSLRMKTQRRRQRC